LKYVLDVFLNIGEILSKPTLIKIMANDRLKEILEKDFADLTEDEWKEVRDLVSAVAGIELEKKEEKTE